MLLICQTLYKAISHPSPNSFLTRCSEVGFDIFVDTVSGAEVGAHLILLWNLGLGITCLIWDPVHFLLCYMELLGGFVFSLFLC